jgi:hypothetical protein
MIILRQLTTTRRNVSGNKLMYLKQSKAIFEVFTLLRHCEDTYSVYPPYEDVDV